MFLCWGDSDLGIAFSTHPGFRRGPGGWLLSPGLHGVFLALLLPLMDGGASSYAHVQVQSCVTLTRLFLC